jgi:hypothetical protein
MIRRRWGQLKSGPAGKRFVAVAALVGVVFLAVRLLEGAVFFAAFMQAAGIGFALMVLLATAHTLVRGAEVEEAEVAGWRMRFSVARRAVGALERRLDAHTRATDQRLLDLERTVFKQTAPGTEVEE